MDESEAVSELVCLCHPAPGRAGAPPAYGARGRAWFLVDHGRKAGMRRQIPRGRQKAGNERAILRQAGMYMLEKGCHRGQSRSAWCWVRAACTYVMSTGGEAPPGSPMKSAEARGEKVGH
jgi:hypothetical protein